MSIDLFFVVGGAVGSFTCVADGWHDSYESKPAQEIKACKSNSPVLYHITARKHNPNRQLYNSHLPQPQP